MQRGKKQALAGWWWPGQGGGVARVETSPGLTPCRPPPLLRVPPLLDPDIATLSLSVPSQLMLTDTFMGRVTEPFLYDPRPLST